MNREILEQPFGPEQIKQREGNFGKMLDYIEGHAVIQRLNDAFEGEWSFTMTKYEVMQETDEVLVIGQLNAGGIVKSQFGSSRITRARETGDIVSLADDLKAAATDALKKAATLLGVGLHLYRSDKSQTAVSRSTGYRQNVQPGNGGSNGSANYRGNGNGNGNNRSYRSDGNGGNNNGNGRLTNNQYKYILKLNDDLGFNRDQLDRRCLESFGTVAQYLSKTDASNLIKQMLVS